MPTDSRSSAVPPSSGIRIKRYLLSSLLLVLAAVSISLLLHGIALWYTPLALIALILAHLTLPAVILHLRRKRVATSLVEDDIEVEPQVSRGKILRLPLFYDWLAFIVTMGKEAQFRRWTLELADLQPGMEVLDIGCGTGTLLMDAVEKVGADGACYGIDPSAEMIHRANEKSSDMNRPPHFKTGYADKIPFTDSSLDRILSTLVFHHFPPSDHTAAIREMKRSLKPGGRIVIVDWQKPTSILRAMAYPMFLIYVLHQVGPAESPLDAPTLGTALKDSGFEVKRTSYGHGGVVGALVADLPSEVSENK
ncbi:methyltransferase domain-containing protein [bacterium]|nr:methyltransferase domain-containing protein [bacterium]